MQVTDNYDRFSFLDYNRDVNLKTPQAKKLAESMIEYGWLDAFPLMATKSKGGKLIVVDGQHRLAVAREYGIPVKYVVEAQDIDVAKINNTPRTWSLSDYVNKFAKGGNKDYEILQHFCEKYGVGISVSAELLGSRSSLVRNGSFKIKDLSRAQKCTESFLLLADVDKRLRKEQSLRALWNCYYVDYFDFDQLLQAAETHQGLIKSMADMEGYLGLFDELYNYHKRDKKPLKFDAQNLARGRQCFKR